MSKKSKHISYDKVIERLNRQFEIENAAQLPSMLYETTTIPQLMTQNNLTSSFELPYYIQEIDYQLNYLNNLFNDNYANNLQMNIALLNNYVRPYCTILEQSLIALNPIVEIRSDLPYVNDCLDIVETYVSSLQNIIDYEDDSEESENSTVSEKLSSVSSEIIKKIGDLTKIKIIFNNPTLKKCLEFITKVVNSIIKKLAKFSLQININSNNITVNNYYIITGEKELKIDVNEEIEKFHKEVDSN